MRVPPLPLRRAVMIPALAGATVIGAALLVLATVVTGPIGPITPGRRASLVGAVLDFPEVQTSARLEADALLGRLNSSSTGSAVLHRKG